MVLHLRISTGLKRHMAQNVQTLPWDDSNWLFEEKSLFFSLDGFPHFNVSAIKYDSKRD